MKPSDRRNSAPQMLPLVALLGLLSAAAASAADAPSVVSGTPAGVAFTRYLAGLEEAHPWNQSTIEIQASLPKLKKEGRLRAIRRLLPIGKPQFQVLETTGDETVKQRVIVRYLSAEAQAAEIPPASIAITPVNYQFRYKGSVTNGGRTSYIFQITPRKKREGLIQGELWLDGETGAPVSQSGRLVKVPSLFLKRVDVTRTMPLSKGITEARITHLTIVARLVGVAELTIIERPYDTSDTTCDCPDTGNSR